MEKPTERGRRGIGREGGEDGEAVGKQCGDDGEGVQGFMIRFDWDMEGGGWEEGGRGLDVGSVLRRSDGRGGVGI